MVSKVKKSEKVILEMWRVSLKNAETQPVIANKLGDYGYDSGVITQGKTVFNKTLVVYSLNKTEDDETLASFAIFKTKRESLYEMYREHRKLGRIIFRNDLVVKEQLGLNGNLSEIYIEWMDKAKKFYTLSAENADIQQKLLRLKLGEEKIAAGKTLVTEVEEARANYLREVGESEDATIHKDTALAEMAEWMGDFYAVARIALKDHSQLLEALGKGVKK